MTKLRRKLITSRQDLMKFTEELQAYPFNDIFTDDTTKEFRMLKYIRTLPQYEQNILYLYAIYNTYTDVAKQLGVSTGIVYKYIKDIRQKIIEHVA